MQYRNLININFDHAYFNGDRRFEYSIRLPGDTTRLAQNFGLLVRLRNSRLCLYSSDIFEAGDMENAGPFWIHLNFSDVHTPNYTGLDYQKDKEILYVGFSAGPDSVEYLFEVKNTLNKLLDLCSTHGVEACEPDQLILPDDSVWTETLPSLLARIEKGMIDEGFIKLEGGAAEGTYLYINNEMWSYPDGIFRIDPSCFQKASAASEPTEFTVMIPAREVYWCYYIIQRSDVELSKISIASQHETENDATELPEFGESESIEFQDFKNALKIVSERPLALKNRYPFSITLNGHLDSDDPLKLPFPGVNLLSSIERSGKVELCSESYIYL